MDMPQSNAADQTHRTQSLAHRQHHNSQCGRSLWVLRPWNQIRSMYAHTQLLASIESCMPAQLARLSYKLRIYYATEEFSLTAVKFEE